MKNINDKELVIALIKDDLINKKLVNGLIGIGLDAGNYFLHLSETVFKLMGFEDAQSNEIFDRYMELASNAMFIDISNADKSMDDLALHIYTDLYSRKVYTQK
jgi:hypothetical protein